MALAATTAFVLLERDKQRQFGAVSFGGFPEFHLKSIKGDEFDQRRIKAGVWAVHTATTEAEVMATARRLAIIEEQTKSGKRHLNILTFIHSPSAQIKPLIPFHHIVVGELKDIPIKDSNIYLVDQEGVIRGKYNLDDVDDYRQFQQDLTRLL